MNSNRDRTQTETTRRLRWMHLRQTLLVAGFALIAARSANAQHFYDMGSLNNFESSANDISADGSMVVGWSTSTLPGSGEAVVWTRNQGLMRLPLPPGIDPNSRASAISADGTTIVGSAGRDYWYTDHFPLVWRNGQASVLSLPPGLARAFVVGVSGDGRRILGESRPDPFGGWEDERAILWTDGVPEIIGQGLSGDIVGVEALSRDGNTALLALDDTDIDHYRWDNGVYTALQDPPGKETWSLSAISADGAVIVGSARDPGPYVLNVEATRWFEGASTPQVIGGLPGNIESQALGVSADGITVLGRSSPCYAYWLCFAEAWQWTPTRGFERIRDLLLSAGQGNAINGWVLERAHAISDDGKVIVGTGVSPQGVHRGWIADLRRVPPNDTCDHPIFIGEGPIPSFDERRTTGTTEDAGSDGASTCGFGGGPDVWYEFSAPIQGYLEIDLCGSLLTNPVVSVHRGCPGGSSNQLFCANDCADVNCDGVCIDPPWVPIEAGQSYLIRVASDKGYTGGLFTLRTRFVPHADDCADAPLLSLPSSTPGVTWTGTVDNVNNCDASPVTAPGVWYRVIGTGTTMTASLCGAADYDTKLSLFCGGCSTLNCLAADDNACGNQSVLSWCSAPGQQYYILVHGSGSNAGSFELSVSSAGGPCGFSWNCTPTNDECNVALPIFEGTTLLDNGAATSGTESTLCGGVAHDLWHSYIPQCTGTLTVDTCQAQIGTLDDTVLSLLDECNGYEWGCNGNYSDPQIDCGLRSVVSTWGTAGREVMIRSGSYPTTGGTGTYPLRITEVPAPVDLHDLTISNVQQFYPVDVSLGLTGGCPPFITPQGAGYFVTTSGLRDGMTVDMYGHLRGTPTTSGVYDFTVSVEDKDITTPGDTATMTMIVSAANGDCAYTQLIREETVEFGNQGMTTDGPSESAACAGQNISIIENDLWFLYESSCHGLATADLCGSSFDTTVAIYPNGTCPTAGSAVACNDDGDCGAQSKVSFDVIDGGEYLIRIGGFGGATGNGLLNVTCFNDCNANGISDRTDIEQATARDCNRNNVPDECELSTGNGSDCNGNGVLDECDIPPGAQPGFRTIGLGNQYNGVLQNDDPAFPSGSVTLGGVPFDIPDTGNNYWHSVVAPDPNPRSMEVAVNLPGVVEVHTLINSYWGQPGSTAYAWIEFFGSDGAYHRKDLVGNVDIRDFNQNFFTNAINDTTTTNVVDLGPHRLDKQRIDLPAIFQSESLVRIRVSDNGGSDFSRIFLAGMTARIGGSFDCNANGSPDECDIAGDADGSGMVDVGDWPMMRDCLTDPCDSVLCDPPIYANNCCAWFDQENDGDVDLVDVAYFQRRQGWTGPTCVQPASGLVGWWPGDENFDDRIGTNDAIPVNGADFGPGYVDAAFQTGPGAVYVQTGANVDIFGNAPRTICAWIKSANDYSTNCCATPFSYGAAYGGGGFGAFISFGKWWFWGYQNDIFTDMDTDTDWHHHCITYDGAEVVYYLDGGEIASQAKSLNTGNSPLVLGDGFDHRADTRFEGLVDEVMLWSRALTPEEVFALVQAGSEGACSP